MVLFFIYFNNFIIESCYHKKVKIPLKAVIIFLGHFLSQLQVLLLPFASLLSTLELLAVGLGWISHRLHALIVQVQAESDSLMERELRLTSRVNVCAFFAAHESFLGVQSGFND